MKTADKGSAVVVMNTEDYLREGYRQVLDQKLYTKIEHDPTPEVSEKITEKTHTHEVKRTYLRKECRIPKTHKLQTCPFLPPSKDPEKRNTRKTYLQFSKLTNCKHLASLWMNILKNMSPIPSLTLDTNRISSVKSPNWAQFLKEPTLDVTSLYTNISNHEGMIAVADHMRRNSSKSPIAIYILELLKLVLHKMYFEFNNEFFLQIGGTAMGYGIGTKLCKLIHGYI